MAVLNAKDLTAASSPTDASRLLIVVNASLNCLGSHVICRTTIDHITLTADCRKPTRIHRDLWPSYLRTF